LRLAIVLALWTAVVSIGAAAPDRQTAPDDALFQTMSWRLLGPFSGGPMTAVAGAASRPHVFFAGTARGGVWKTTDAGGTWRPVFDDQPTGVIGTIALSPSNPDVVIVGTGTAPLASDVASGAGLFRSTDGGATWVSIGLHDEPHITAVQIDPRQ